MRENSLDTAHRRRYKIPSLSGEGSIFLRRPRRPVPDRTFLSHTGGRPLATHKSALKRHRQSIVNRLRNRKVRSQVRSAAKKVVTLAEAGDAEKAADALKNATRVIDKAASKGVIKKSNASRKNARLAKKVNQIGA